MESSQVSFNTSLSSIHAKISLLSKQSLQSIASMFCQELCEDFRQELRDLKEKHWNKCGQCNPSLLSCELQNGSTNFLNESIVKEKLPDISESKIVYIDPQTNQVVQEGEDLNFSVQYKGALKNATIYLEKLGLRNYDLYFNLEDEKFGLHWKQTVAKREHAEEICKQVQTLESLELNCNDETENWRRLVEAIEDRVFSNTLAKSIEIKADPDRMNDDWLKTLLASLSPNNSNLYLSLDLSGNSQITNELRYQLFDCLKKWQKNGFRYLILNLNHTGVTLDFIDMLCDRLPISLKGLWLDVEHLKIDQQRSQKLINFLKTHHSYMKFFVININSDRDQEEVNQQTIHKIFKIQDRLKLFSMIGRVSQKLKDKILRSFENFGGGKLQIESKDPGLRSKTISGINEYSGLNLAIGEQKIYNNRSGEVATTLTTQAGTGIGNDDPSYKGLNDNPNDSQNEYSDEKSLNSNFKSQEIKILAESDSS